MSESSAETRSQLVRISYALLLIGLLTGGVTALVGAVIAHLQAPDAPEPHKAHFRFQYRTFWIGLLYNLIAGITTLALIGWLLLVIIVIWWIVRCVRGLNSLANGEPPSNLTTWGFQGLALPLAVIKTSYGSATLAGPQTGRTSWLYCVRSR